MKRGKTANNQRIIPFPYAGIVRIRLLGYHLSPCFLSGTPLTEMEIIYEE